MPDGIGILSVVPYAGTDFETAFEAGFNVANITYRNSQHSLGHGAGDLSNGLQALLDDQQVTLIVAVGGLVSELAADRSTKAYISLVGGAPQNPGMHFRGRVNLGSVGDNQMRRTHLNNRTIHDIPFNRHCLLSNPLTGFSAQEQTGGGIAWGRVEPADIRKDDTVLQVRHKFANAFAQIGTTNMRAVVVSADSWYTKHKNELVSAANQWVDQAGTSRRVSYPFQEYRSAQPVPRKACFCGPSILEAYNHVGRLAAHVLVGGGAPGNLQKPCTHLAASGQEDAADNEPRP
jgi:hypothetical protein